MFSLLQLEAFAERHQHWLHAVWVVAWTLILMYVSLLFVFVALDNHPIADVVLAQPMLWLAGLFVVELGLVLVMMPLVHWGVPAIGVLVMNRGYFMLESMYYFVFAFQFFPAAVAALLGIVVTVLMITSNFLVAALAQKLWFYLFPVVMLVCILFVLGKGTWMLEQSGVDRKQGLLFFGWLMLMHLVASFVNVAIVILGVKLWLSFL